MNRFLRKVIKGEVGKRILLLLPERFMYFGPPKFLDIEITNICNLKCALCPHEKMQRKQEFMDVKKFKKLIDELVPINLTIYLINWGESLLHPKICEMIKYASSKGIRTMISSNLSMNLSNKKITELVESGLKKLIIALDGPDKKTYESYRIGGDLSLVITNLKRILEQRKKSKVEDLEIEIHLLMLKQTENKVKEMISLCKKLGVDSLLLKPVLLKEGISYTKKNLELEKEEAKKFLPEKEEYNRYDTDLKIKKEIKVCPVIKQASILVNGDISLCCMDYEGRYIIGNAFNEGFMNVWKSKRYKKIRKMIIEKANPLCQNCEATEFPIKTFNFKEK